MIVKKPETLQEFEEYYSLRWKILRKPLGESMGSEKDNLENDSFHLMIQNICRPVRRINFVR